MAGETDARPDVELCPHCARPVTGGGHFCNHCGCPVWATATSLPYERILAQGFMLRTGSRRPRSAIVLVGLWMLMGPFLVLSLLTGAGSLYALAAGFGRLTVERLGGALWGVLLGSGGALLSAVLLAKTTRNYRKLRRRAAARKSESEESE